MPKGKLWTAHDEAEHIGSYALPGGAHPEFGMARNWHFFGAIIWLATGAVYWGWMFTTGNWRRLIPTSWDVFPGAVQNAIDYVTFNLPPESAFNPYDDIQQLSYAAVVFILAPLMILTALAMSPAFTNRFPRYVLLFGGRRQVARSLHFIGMLLFSLFIIVHVAMVCLVYFYRNVKLITFGTTDVSIAAAITTLLAALLFILLVNIFITYFTLNYRVAVRRMLVAIVEPVVHLAFGRLRPRNNYTKQDISPFFRVNGYPPETSEFKKLQKDNFKNWKLEVGGLVKNNLSLSLKDLKDLPYTDQITKHICIQGWSAIGQWGGVRMSQIMRLAQPKSDVKYVVFHAYDEDHNEYHYYEALRLSDMSDEQTILAYEMNWKPLPLEHGAPIRLRCERKLGYKMVKYIKSIEFVSEIKSIERGRGGYREDNVLFDWEASI